VPSSVWYQPSCEEVLAIVRNESEREFCRGETQSRFLTRDVFC